MHKHKIWHAVTTTFTVRTERFQFQPFWTLTRLGFIRNVLPQRGRDEWGNRSIHFIIPLVGWFVFFYERNIDRSTWWFTGTWGNLAQYVSPDYGYTAHLTMGHVTPDRLTFDEVFRHADKVTVNEWAEVHKRAREAKPVDFSTL